MAAGTTPEGLAFLEENARKEGVVVTESGLQYRIIQSGEDNDHHPGVSTPCSCHYAGRLMDGTEFDSSFKRCQPTTFAPNQVIRGWTEAMQLMTQGAHWELVIPSELAYGDMQRGPHITPGAVLIFELQLLKILDDNSEL